MPRRKKVQNEQTDMREPKYKSISARTDEQKEYIKAIIQNDIIICCGKSGSGKTCVASGVAVDFLRRGLIDRIIISRPQIAAEDKGRGGGYLPGTAEEKIAPFLLPLYTELEEFIDVKQAVAQNKIKILPVSYMRGVTWKNSYVIVDEAQNLTEPQLKLILTRLGENSKLVLTGDIKQSDLDGKEKNDFQKVIKKLTPFATPENKICIIKLTISVRHPLIEIIEQAFDI